MNFTKEYIKEADCAEIQGLRKELQNGDWLAYRGIVDLYTFRDYLYNRGSVTWLPTEGQLDQSIRKICAKIKSSYDTYFNNKQIVFWISEFGDKSITIDNDNPLIAKISLLKQLLKESK